MPADACQFFYNCKGAAARSTAPFMGAAIAILAFGDR